MSTDYTIHKVKLSNGKRIETKIDDFIKHYNSYLTIEDEQENDYGKEFGVKNIEGLYLWIYTDFNNIINGCCRYGSNWNEDISSLLETYQINQLDNETINYYKNEHSIDITQYLLISEHYMGLIYDLCDDKKHKLINDICGDDYYENYRLECLNDTFTGFFTKDELINKTTESLINQYMGIDEKYYKHLLEMKLENYGDEIKSYIQLFKKLHNSCLEYCEKGRILENVIQ